MMSTTEDGKRVNQRRRTVCRALLIAAAFLGFQVGAAAAQGTIAGTLTDATSGRALISASVSVADLGIVALSRADGLYTLEGVPAGEQTLVVRALGYRTATVTVTVVSGQTVSANVQLMVRPLELGGIQVSVLRPDLQPQVELAEREVREANPKDSGQLLRALDGVDAVRRGPLGLDPVIRGLRETEVGTYLDGTRLFPAGPARMDSPLTHLDPSAVQDIEVVKGPYALTWGAGNLGAIRVATAPLPGRGREGLSGNVSTGYDSNLSASEFSGGISFRTGPYSVQVNGAMRGGDDYEDGNGNAVPAQFSSQEIRGKVGMDFGDYSMLQIAGGYQDQGPINYPGRLLQAKSFFASNLAATWTTERSSGLLRNLEISAYRNAVSHAMNNLGKPTQQPMAMRTPPFPLRVYVGSDLAVIGGRAAADLVSGDWSIRLGGDLYSANRDATRWIFRLENDTSGYPGPPPGALIPTGVIPANPNNMWPDATVTDIGVFGRVGRTVNDVRLAGTVRLDQVSSDAKNPNDTFITYLGGDTDLSRSETNVSAAFTAGTRLNSIWDVSLGLGSAVRTADASERYSDHIQATKAQTAAEFMGNPDLSPERSTQVDIWLEGSLPESAVQVNLFARRVSDYITVALTNETKHLPPQIFPTEVYGYVNGEATFFGAEASITNALTEALTLELGASYLRGEETLFPTTDATNEVTEAAFGIAPLKGRIGLRYEDPAGTHYVETTATVTAEQDHVAETRGEQLTPGYTVVDIRAGWAPYQGVNLRFGVENVFDEAYYNHLNSRNPYNGSPIFEPGTVIYVDVSYAF